MSNIYYKYQQICHATRGRESHRQSSLPEAALRRRSQAEGYSKPRMPLYLRSCECWCLHQRLTRWASLPPPCSLDRQISSINQVRFTSLSNAGQINAGGRRIKLSITVRGLPFGFISLRASSGAGLSVSGTGLRHHLTTSSFSGSWLRVQGLLSLGFGTT